MRRRYGWWLLGSGLIGAAGVGWLVFSSLPPSPPAGVIDRLDRIRLGMSPKEVSGLMAGWAEMNSHCWGNPDPSFRPGQWFSEDASYNVGNGWMVEVTFYDDKLGNKLLFYPRDPPLYRLAWASLQERFHSLPDLPF
jgi:hypothetical protein